MTGINNGRKISMDQMRDLLANGGGITKQEEIGKASVDDDGKVTLYNTTLEKVGEEVHKYAVSKLKPAMSQAIAAITEADVKKLGDKLTADQESTREELLALAGTVRTIEIVTPKVTKKLKGVQHDKFEALLKVVGTGQPVLLVGPAGTGKTHAAAEVANAYDLEFHSIAVGAQTSKSDLVGYMDANHNYVRTQFREAYENGGLFLLDEADAGNSNVLILLNAALSNGYMAFPDGMIKRHDSFRMVATANTYGHGASRQYVGRNQLDAATLDRFVTIAWDIDEKVESALAGTDPNGKKWLAVVRAVRQKAIVEMELRVVISPRATQRGAMLLAAGMTFEDVLPIALTGNMPGTERPVLENVAKAVWTK